MASSIGSLLPKPKYSNDKNEENPAQNSGIRVVTELGAAERKALIKTYSIPSYGERGPSSGNSWKPKTVEDYGDGGAYPEIHILQYPRNMGSSKSSSGGNSLALTVTSEGKVDYTSIARQGHSKSRIIQASFNDLVPLRQRVKNGELSLDRPSEDEVKSTTEKTQAALQKILDAKISSSNSKSAVALSNKKNDATYVRYTPSNMMGESSDVKHRQRIIKIVDVAQDPLEPPKFKHTKVPPRPPSPPPPVLRSPPRKLTAEDQKNWYIPPSVSNWKNSKGFTIAIDKRMAADGRNLQAAAGVHTINDNFAKLSESLAVADVKMREEVSQRNAMRKKLAEKEEKEREERMRKLAQRAKEEREKLISSRSGKQSRWAAKSKSKEVEEPEIKEEENEEEISVKEEEREPIHTPRRDSLSQEDDDSVSPPSYREKKTEKAIEPKDSPLRRPRSISRSPSRSRSVSREPPRSRKPEPETRPRRRDSETRSRHSPRREFSHYKDEEPGRSRYRKSYHRSISPSVSRSRSRSVSSDESPDGRYSRRYSRDFRSRDSDRRSGRDREHEKKRDYGREHRSSRREHYESSRYRRSRHSDSESDRSESEDDRYDRSRAYRSSRSRYDGDRKPSSSRRSHRSEEDEEEDDRKSKSSQGRYQELPDERRRRKMREERLAEAKRKLQLSKMGASSRAKSMLKSDGDRDISERVALGVAKPSTVSTGDSQFDSRLFGSVSVSSNFNEDQAYDKPLFQTGQALQAIYLPKTSANLDDDDDSTLNEITKESRFETLGRVKNGFQGTESGGPTREGPVEFEKDDGKVMNTEDPYGVDKMINEIKDESSKQKNKGKRR